MPETTREFYAALYDAAFPGLEYEWVRLCERVRASLDFDFDGKDLNAVLQPLAARELPASMLDTLRALRDRRELSNAAAGADALRRYAETLRAELDEFADGEEAHVVEMSYDERHVRVQIVLYEAADAPRETIRLRAVAAAGAGERESALRAATVGLAFVRENNNFKFSPAFARKDANDVIGYVLENSRLSADDLAAAWQTGDQ